MDRIEEILQEQRAGYISALLAEADVGLLTRRTESEETYVALLRFLFERDRTGALPFLDRSRP